jgi:hypothetical protein
VWSWGKIDVVLPVALDSICTVDNSCVNPDNGVFVVDEIPRESLALESPIKSVLVQGIDLGFISASKAMERDEDYEDVGEKWIEVIRKSRGKHPRKKLQC